MSPTQVSVSELSLCPVLFIILCLSHVHLFLIRGTHLFPGRYRIFYFIYFKDKNLTARIAKTLFVVSEQMELLETRSIILNKAEVPAH